MIGLNVNEVDLMQMGSAFFIAPSAYISACPLRRQIIQPIDYISRTLRAYFLSCFAAMPV
jgi:hypothetical protein